MNLLFFDIECASVFKNVAKICAFGYVLCDEQFNIIEKEDILINPKGKFHLTDRKGENGLVLPYEYEDFKKYPTFPQMYDRIRALLEDKNNLPIGHAVMNDVNFLDLETNRFKLPPFHFSFTDTQLIYMTKIGNFTQQVGLERLIEELHIEFTPHKAMDDAYATMCICRAMCQEQGCTLTQLEKSLGMIHGKIENHKRTPVTSKAFNAYTKQAQQKKEERAKTRIEFFEFVSRHHAKKQGILKDKIITFSRAIEDTLSISKALVNEIYDNGGSYSSKVNLCHIYVTANDDISVRTQNAKKRSDVTIMTVEEFKEYIHA